MRSMLQLRLLRFVVWSRVRHWPDLRERGDVALPHGLRVVPAPPRRTEGTADGGWTLAGQGKAFRKLARKRSTASKGLMFFPSKIVPMLTVNYVSCILSPLRMHEMHISYLRLISVVVIVWIVITRGIRWFAIWKKTKLYFSKALVGFSMEQKSRLLK